MIRRYVASSEIFEQQKEKPAEVEDKTPTPAEVKEKPAEVKDKTAEVNEKPAEVNEKAPAKKKRKKN